MVSKTWMLTWIDTGAMEQNMAAALQCSHSQCNAVSSGDGERKEKKHP